MNKSHRVSWGRLRYPVWGRASAFAIGVLFSCAASPADEHVIPDGITVTGSGEVLADPDCLEIDVGASGSAELTGDAIIKYRDRLRRVTEAFKKLDIQRLRVDERELSIHNGADEQHGRPHVTIGRALRIVVTDIHQIAEDDLLSIVGKVIDAAKDTGVATEESQSGMFTVRFALRDPRAVREQACQKAFEDAKEQASRLAKLAGGKLGRAAGVADVPVDKNPSVVADVLQAISIYEREELEPEEQGRMVSAGLKPIPVRVSLRVRFELLKEPEGAAEAALEK